MVSLRYNGRNKNFRKKLSKRNISKKSKKIRKLSKHKLSRISRKQDEISLLSSEKKVLEYKKSHKLLRLTDFKDLKTGQKYTSHLLMLMIKFINLYLLFIKLKKLLVSGTNIVFMANHHIPEIYLWVSKVLEKLNLLKVLMKVVHTWINQ